MEEETIWDNLYQLALSKQSDMYKNSVIILVKTKNILTQKNVFDISNQPSSLMSAISQCLFMQVQAPNPSQVDSYLFLLNNIISRVSGEIVEKHSQQIILLIQQVFKLKKCQKEQINLKLSIAILCQMIIHMKNGQSEEILKHSETILQFITDDQSYLRKEALKAIKLIFEKKNIIKKKFSEKVKQFCLSNLGPQEENAHMNVTQFISSTCTVLPLDLISDLSYSIVKLLPNADQDLQIHIYLTFETIMSQRPLNPDISENLLKDFVENQPSFYDDEKLIFAFAQCLVQTLLHLNTFGQKTAQKYIPGIISILIEILLIDKSKLAIFAQKTLEVVIINTVNSSLWSKNYDPNSLEGILGLDDMNIENDKGTCFQKIVIMLKQMMSSRFDKVQKHVLEIYGTFFQKISQDVFYQIEDFVKIFIESRTERPYHLWERSMGKLVENIGADILLTLYPINLNEDPLDEEFEDKTNLWMTSMLLKYAKNQLLSVFMKFLVPIIKLLADSINFKSQTLSASHKILTRVFLQLWECFPKFTSIPVAAKQRKIEVEHLGLFMENIIPQLDESLPQFDSIVRGLEIILTNCIDFEDVKKVMTGKSQELISKFAKLVIPGKQKNKTYLQVITCLAKVAPKEYLDKAFSRNIEKLIQDKKNEKIKSNYQSSLKNLDILLSVAPAVELRNDKWKLSMEFANLFLSDNSILQKKAYKFLQGIVGKVDPTFLNEIIEIFSNQEQIAPCSRPQRLTMIKFLYTRMDLENKSQEDLAEFIQTFLPEIIVGCRDQNKRTRKIAGEMLEILTKYMQSNGYIKMFMSWIAAGLTAESSLMQADSISALAQLTEILGKDVDLDYLVEINSIILMLFRDPNKEILKSALSFFKKLFKVISKDQLQLIAPSIFQSIFQIEDSVRDHYRSQLKYLIQRMIRKFGLEFVDGCVPEAHKRFVRASNKSQNLEKNKKIKEKKLKKLERLEFEEENNIEPVKKLEDNLLLKYDSEKQNYHFVEHNVKKVKEKMVQEKQELKDVEYLNGKLIVRQIVEDISGKKRRREDRYTNMDAIMAMELGEKADDGELTKADKQPRMVRKLAKDKTHKKIDYIHDVKESGQSFKAKGNTGGDVQLKDKPEPYAFIQLNAKALNKRFRNKASRAFDLVMNQKSAGGLKGLKTNKKVKID